MTGKDLACLQRIRAQEARQTKKAHDLSVRSAESHSNHFQQSPHPQLGGETTFYDENMKESGGSIAL